ncbi:MAG TPA: hypothetical protein PKC39_06115 [Ferruginibacter sp.]|nr:hypothetical protein [Ferruginibacter sp.]HMP20517.1 hypothetical protein [Ferruginibacter sp.]
MTTPLTAPVTEVLTQLKNLLTRIDDAIYIQQVPAIFNASIGQHTRHIAELFTELYKGYNNAVVDYDRRERNKLIENNVYAAIQMIQFIMDEVPKPDKEIHLHTSYRANGENAVVTKSSYYRELVYNIEHTVHHLAIIRVALTEQGITINEDFGFADGTIKNNAACVQ